MAARGSTSRKASGASSASKQPHDLVFFTDKCLGRNVVADALRAIGCRVEVLTDHFEQDTPDSEWLAEVGKRKWVILSKDKHLRHNHIEIIELLRSGTHSFILTSGNFTGKEIAQAFVNDMPHIKAMIAKFDPPFVATVTKGGTVKVHWTFDDLIGRVAEIREESD